MTDRVVIIGAGQAGGEAAAGLRMAGYGGEIVLIGDEPHLPYTRPPLSKAYLLGDAGVDDMRLRPQEYYDKQGIELRLGRTARRIDRAAQVVELDDGERLEYGDLIIATGGRARRLETAGLADAANVHYIRDIADVDRLRGDLLPGRRLTVIGGGYVGLELAAAARKLGLEVSVLEAAPRLLARVAGPEISRFFFRLHADAGVDIRLGTAAEGFGFDADGRVREVLLPDGVALPTDVLVIGIGLVPNDSLALESGLEVDNGIVVDELFRTADAHVYAIGDVARHPCNIHGGLRRLESVPNASEHARIVATSILGQERPRSGVPWFWSDQYDVKLQGVGISTPEDTIVVRGSVDEGRSFAVFYLDDGRVNAAEVVGRARDFAAAKKLIADRTPVDPARLADESVELKSLYAGAPSPAGG